MFASVQLIVALTPGTPSHCSVAAEPEYTAKAQSPSVVPIFALVVNLAILDRIFISGTWFEVWFGGSCGNYYSAMDAFLAHAQHSCMSRHYLTLFQPRLIYCCQSFCLPSESRTGTSNRRACTAKFNVYFQDATLHMQKWEWTSKRTIWTIDLYLCRLVSPAFGTCLAGGYTLYRRRCSDGE